MSLVEALVAIAILSSSIIPIILFLSVGTETVRGTRDTAGAVFVANRTLEELRALPQDGLPEAARRIQASPNIDLGPITYRRTLTLTPTTEKSGIAGALAWLRVEWARDRRKTMAYEVGTFLSDVR